MKTAKTPDEIKKGLECCIEMCCRGNCPYFEDPECTTSVRKDAFSLIQQLEAYNAQLERCIENMTDKLNAANDAIPCWIPVEERMPAPHEDVAIIIRQGGYAYLRVGWYVCACQWMQAGLGMIEGEVTHWLPLPESPKEE